MSILSIKKATHLRGRRVLVRVDFNVPMKGKKIVDDTRLRASVPTIQYLLGNGAKVILVTHVGRPRGRYAAALSVAPLAKRLKEMLGVKELKVVELKKALHTKISDISMLENIRFYSGEEKNDRAFAKQLASLADMFVLDGFAVAHREAASVCGVARLLPSYAGILLEKEITGLDRVMKRAKKPFVLALGGAKMETKLPVMRKFLPSVSALLVGGGIVNTMLKARGYGVGGSLVDRAFLAEALRMSRNKKIIFPNDVIVGVRSGKKYRHVLLQKKPHEVCKKREEILDVGPATMRRYAGYIKKARTLVWNGAMGYFEQPPYHHATLAMARLVASRSKGEAFGVIGGGETVQVMEMTGMSEYVDLVSTGGGAMLEYLAGKKLPGIEALKKH